MAFTYDLASTDATLLLISKVRFELGDNVLGGGVCPNNANLSDEEIAVILVREGNSIPRTVVALCNILARQWARFADTKAGPLQESSSQVSRAWRMEGNRLAQSLGLMGTPFSGLFNRDDAYSDVTTTSENTEHSA